MESSTAIADDSSTTETQSRIRRQAAKKPKKGLIYIIS
jgi:hypothetical protein